MPKPAKVQVVEELRVHLEEAPAALLAEYRGLRVGEMQDLRRTLAQAGAEFKVVKNTLARIAAREVALDGLLPLLEGSTAIAFVRGDPVAAARLLDELAKKYPALVVKGGVLEGRILDATRAQALAWIRPREVLLAQLAGLLQAPLQGMALALSAPLRTLAHLLQAYREKLALPAGAGE
ncbi:MAG: 50S ribosomal protein L10 [Actinomycetota bacterium]